MGFYFSGCLKTQTFFFLRNAIIFLFFLIKIFYNAIVVFNVNDNVSYLSIIYLKNKGFIYNEFIRIAYWTVCGN